MIGKKGLYANWGSNSTMKTKPVSRDKENQVGTNRKSGLGHTIARKKTNAPGAMPLPPRGLVVRKAVAMVARASRQRRQDKGLQYPVLGPTRQQSDLYMTMQRKQGYVYSLFVNITPLIRNIISGLDV